MSTGGLFLSYHSSLITYHVPKMTYKENNDPGRIARVGRGAEGWLRTIFIEDWSLKLLALAITLGLWFGVTGQRTPATVRLSSVLLNFRLPGEMEISNEPPERIDVILTGSKEALDRLNSRNLIAFVDVSGYLQGTHNVRLMRDNVTMDLPEGVHINAIDPNHLVLRLELRQVREVPVEVEFSGKLPEGYELRGFAPTSSNVTVRGPASHINELTLVRTQKISLDGLIADTNVAQVPIALNDNKVTVSEPVIGVSLKIGEQRIEKDFSGVAVSEGSGMVARPQIAIVTAYGDRSVINRLRSEDMKIILDVMQDGAVVPHLSLPSGMDGRVELRSTKPTGFTIVK